MATQQPHRGNAASGTVFSAADSYRLSRSKPYNKMAFYRRSTADGATQLH